MNLKTTPVMFKTDLYGSYMLVEIPSQIERSSYSFKMMEKNKIAGTLSGKERLEDGKAFYYLDITGKKNLVQEYADSEMELEDMAELFRQILCILEELKNYLLTEKMVLLEPEYLYKDMEDDNLYVTLLPWESAEQETFRKLAEFFLEKINHRDEHGVNAAYHFYRQQSQPNFSIYHFMPILEKEMILKRQKENNSISYRTPEKFLIPEKKVESPGKQEEEYQKLDLSQKQEKEKKETKNSVWIWGFLLGFLVFLLSWIPQIERVQKGALIVLSITIIAVSGCTILFTFMRDKRSNKGAREEIEKTNLQKEETIVEYQETVFFDPSQEDDLLKLQWKERGRSKQYTVQNLPITIGKMQNEVSLVIADASVSRVHCRMVEYNGGIGIMDMNSTNGTYLNGMKLRTGEVLEIVKNDEILIGKVKLLVV